MEIVDTKMDDEERGVVPAAYYAWLYKITRDSFGSLTMEEVLPYDIQLRTIFALITYQKGHTRYFSSRYNLPQVEANIRKAFCDRRSYKTKEEQIPLSVSLPNITNFTQTVETEHPDKYYPSQEDVQKIVLDDQGKLKVDKKAQAMMDLAQEMGQEDVLAMLHKKYSSYPRKNHSFHYLPYHTDSSFEQTFLHDVLTFPEIESLGLEVYYNGDRSMTEFKIKCYKRNAKVWQYVGMYTPDFLILQREDGKIQKVIIVETKGEAYANDPKFKDKKDFVQTEFLRLNNSAFGYERFEYLYLEDTMPERDRLALTKDTINNFFKV